MSSLGLKTEFHARNFTHEEDSCVLRDKRHNFCSDDIIYKIIGYACDSDWIIAEGLEGFMHSLKEPTFSVAKFFSYVFLGWLKPDGDRPTVFGGTYSLGRLGTSSWWA